MTRANLPPWDAPRVVARWRIRVYAKDVAALPPKWNDLGFLPGVFDSLSQAQDALYDVAGEHPRPNRGYRIVEVSAP